MGETGIHPAEKSFYLNAFRGRCVLLHLAEGTPATVVRPVADELAGAGVLLVVSAVAGGRTAPDLCDLKSAQESGLNAAALSLVRRGRARVTRPSGWSASRSLSLSLVVAARLGAHKVVVVDSRGGLVKGSGFRSFVHATTLSRLLRSPRSLGGWSVAELRAIRDSFRSGVESVNLTTAASLGRELFTYEGDGTLITPTAYCRVRPLRAEDYQAALKMVRRGEQEGFLLRRTQVQRAALMLNGFGAWLDGRRLAGVAGLETAAYRRSAAAEIVGVYAITRFHGEGVGVALIHGLLGEAERRGCRTVFACTSNTRAAEFFTRHGFVEVGRTAVPAAKWKGRPPGPWPRVFLRRIG